MKFGHLHLAGVIFLAFALPGGSVCLSQQGVQQASANAPLTRVLRLTPDNRDTRLENHPLQDAIRIAKDHYRYIHEQIRDYTCVIIKRERVDGELLPIEQMFVKCRQEQTQDDRTVTPFSVYMKFIAPRNIVGREVLYVKGRDGGDVLIRKGGQRNDYLNWWIDPHGDMAMRDNRYPITEFGIENLVRRVIEVAEEELAYDECEVKYYENAKVDKRNCLVIEVRHPVKRDHFRYYLVRVFIDDELHVPMHFETYGWPESDGDPPQLLEQYTFRQMKLNVGLTDADFDRLNPDYGFRKE